MKGMHVCRLVGRVKGVKAGNQLGRLASQYTGCSGVFVGIGKGRGRDNSKYISNCSLKANKHR